MRHLLLFLFAALPAPLAAQTMADAVGLVLDEHVLPGYAVLVEQTETLEATAEAHCAPDDAALRSAYNAAFDAWLGVSHLRFGPAEVDNRGFALAFWPDSRGSTPSSLRDLILNADPVIETAEDFETVSVAARGFYALEFLIYDPEISGLAASDYGCALIQRVAADIHRTSSAIAEDWRMSEALLLRSAGGNDRYAGPEDAARRLYSALVEGLEFTANLRLGRPMGAIGDPRPRRAEAWRSGRSLRNVALSIDSLAEMATLLASVEGADRADINREFADAQDRAAALDDPIFAGVETPTGRLRVEALQQRVIGAFNSVQAGLAPALGVTVTFNALDGD
ncbi:MAG: imelysin family protein [Pseudomonadota bacterium]